MVLLNRFFRPGFGIAAALVMLPLASGVAAATGTTTTPSSAPKSLLAASLRAARKESSVHFVATSAVGTRSITITGDASASAGSQVIVLHEGKSTGHVTGRYVDKAVYFRGDTIGLEDYLGMPSTLAPKYSGKWIAFGSSTPNYSSIAKSMTLSAAVAQISVKAPITRGAHATVDGQAAVSVLGSTTTLSSKGKKGTATLYVAAKGSPLPISYLGTGKQKEQSETGKVSFSKWGEKVSPSVPPNAVPASSISGSGSGSSG